MQAVEVFAACVGDDYHVLNPDAADGFAVEARLDGHDIAGDELRATCGQEGWFVDLEPQAVAGAVGHARKGIRCIG